MLIPQAVLDRLNEQIANEFHAAHNYLAMACRFDGMGLKMLSQWFRRQGEEEREHGMKLLNYVLEVDGEVKLGPIGTPRGDMSSPISIVQTALDQEREVTRCIHEIVTLAEEHKDYSTRSFLNWFIDEQVEEVATMTDLLQLVKMAGDNNLLQVEARVAKMMQAAT